MSFTFKSVLIYMKFLSYKNVITTYVLTRIRTKSDLCCVWMAGRIHGAKCQGETDIRKSIEGRGVERANEGGSVP